MSQIELNIHEASDNFDLSPTERNQNSFDQYTNFKSFHSDYIESFIHDIIDLFAITTDNAYGIYYEYGNVELHDLQEKWFDNCQIIEDVVQFAHEETQLCLHNEITTCGICYSEEDITLYSICKSHYYCHQCWSTYIDTILKNINFKTVMSIRHFRCPGCQNARIPRSFVLEEFNHLSNSIYNIEVKLYSKFHPDLCQICPNCDQCILIYKGRKKNDNNSGIYVKCNNCLKYLCFSCMSLSCHHPVSCETLANWTRKNDAESANASWIGLNTKPCPSCERPIEKNQGCNHMTCPKASGGCGGEFCWICLAPWSSHGSGEYYTCNKYQQCDSLTKNKPSNKNDLEKYLFHFERFSNHESCEKLIEQFQLPILLPIYIDRLVKLLSLFEDDFHFLSDLLNQLIECRIVLKYTHVYAYYFHLSELFLDIQTNLENKTDCLQELFEINLVNLLFKYCSEEEYVILSKQRDVIFRGNTMPTSIDNPIKRLCVENPNHLNKLQSPDVITKYFKVKQSSNLVRGVLSIDRIEDYVILYKESHEFKDVIYEFNLMKSKILTLLNVVVSFRNRVTNGIIEKNGI